MKKQTQTPAIDLPDQVYYVHLNRSGINGTTMIIDLMEIFKQLK